MLIWIHEKRAKGLRVLLYPLEPGLSAVCGTDCCCLSLRSLVSCWAVCFFSQLAVAPSKVKGTVVSLVSLVSRSLN